MDQGKPVGDWKCIRLLGKGSFGIVRLWKCTKTGKLNAAKEFEIHLQPYQQPLTEKRITEMQTLWRKEVELMHSVIECPHIVSAVPVPEDLAFANSTLPILFLEYCSGGDLRQVLKRPENVNGLREKDALTVLDHLAKAIAYLHEKKIIHRDLKPDNILIHYDSSNKITYKLSDLGFAKDLSNNQTVCSTFVGTPQYLAPEIYMGKTYDKTVDYWSFGVIAYELICGLRPFLHGESQPNWFPLVESKGKDIISIYRNSEGGIAFSNTIPYNTHFSDVKKKCLECWLRTMLQLDPSMRGKRIEESIGKSSSSTETVNLKILEHFLATKFLHIHTAKKQLAYPIGSHTTMSEIQQRISVETGLVPDNQLILTIDGVEIQKTDLASKFLEMDLYLIPRCADLIRLKIKFPTAVNNFLSEWDSIKDPTKLRRVWSCAIYFVQTESQKVEIVKKSTEALKAWCNTNYTNQLKAYRNEIEKAAAGLGKVLELESRLEEVDKLQNSSPTGENAIKNEGEESKTGVSFWTQEMSTLQNFYSNCLDDWVENVVLKPVRTTEMEEVYYKMLKGCGDWKSSDSSSSPFSYNELLKRSVCQFLVQRDEIDDALLHNITIQLEKVKSDAKLIEEMKSIITKLDQLTFDIMQRRCAKQSVLIEKVNQVVQTNGLQTPESNGIVKKEGSPAYATIQPKPKSPNPYSIRGGGYPDRDRPSSTPMTQSSTLPVKKPVGQQSGIMAESLNTGLKISLQRQYPLINKLMEESRILTSQTELGMKSLNDSLEELKEIMSEQD